ncbi:MAG: DNA-directed RNA polymerase subunit alpha [Patescibacteria group bacterium]
MISYPKKPQIIEQKDNWAKFQIEDLYPGYGVTVGNSLRRVLLSSLPGSAITQMKITNVPHEFSTLPGVLEDIILIMQNLKEISFKVHGDEPQIGVLKIKGEKEIKASDFKLPSQVELINKDCHVATLTRKTAELEMEVKIEKGVGYVPRENRNKEKLEIGAILLDAIFSPVQKVSFRVENMRVGNRTDFDRLFLEIETNGTITPEEALNQSSEILVKHFSLVETLNGKKEKKAVEEKVPVKKEEKKTVKTKKAVIKKDEKKNKRKKVK